MFCAFTDGACKGNPGKGGWGWAEFMKGSNIIISNYGGCINTTNNRMEIQAVIEYLSYLPLGSDAIIHSDSQYVLKSLIRNENGEKLFFKSDVRYTGWIAGWKRNQWKTKDSSNIKNIDLWKQLDTLLRKHLSNGSSLEFRYVKGHSDSNGNNLADLLANEGVKMINQCTRE